MKTCMKASVEPKPRAREGNSMNHIAGQFTSPQPPAFLPSRGVALLGMLAAGILFAFSIAGTAATPTRATVARNYGHLPLRFEANQGQFNQAQTPSPVQFFARGVGYSLSLTNQEAILALRKSKSSSKADVLHMQLTGSNPSLRVQGQERLPGTSNYLLGSDPSEWHTNVPAYARVQYPNVYDGIDLVYYGNQGQLEYDFVVAPHVDPKPIQLHFAGAQSLRIDPAGNLVISASNGSIAFHKPVVYQLENGHRRTVSGRFTLLADNSAGFSLGRYNQAEPLIIDPTLVYSTYLGGSNSDTINAIALDVSGNAYLTGTTLSADYPVTPGVFQSTDTDLKSSVFVTKLNSSGTALIYSTYLGGSGGPSGGDIGQSIAVDAAGDAYVTGYTYSANFPTTKGAYQTTNKAAAVSGSTSFVTKLNPTGTALLYSTFLGGTTSDNATSIAIDTAGDAYVAGVSYSANFPVTAGVLQTTNKSAPSYDGSAFVTKLNPTGTGLLYSTFLGGSGDYIAQATVCVAIDKLGDAYVSGEVSSADFPVTAGAYQTTNKGLTGGGSNLTLSELNPTATKLLYSTYLGGSGAGYRGDVTNSLAIDSAGNAYLAGSTYELNFPVTKGAFQTTNKVGGAAPTGFVTKMNPTGTALVYSTFLGGTGGTDGDRAAGLAIDSAGDAYITGSTGSTDFPVTSNAYQTTNAAAFNNGAVVFLAELNPAGASLLYSTYFGGAYSYADIGNGLALGKAGAYFAGSTGAKDFPITKGAYNATFNSTNFSMGFVSLLSLSTAPATLPTNTLLTSIANPAVTGTSLTFTAAVTPATGTGVPTGSVVFNIDQVNVATVALNSLGYATYNTATPLALGAHSILASYQGSTTYSASGGNITEDITPLNPTITPPSGVHTAAFIVTLADATASSVLYYTLDGTTPTSSSTKYTAPFLVSTNTQVNAVAIVSGKPASNVVSASYKLISSPYALAVPPTLLTASGATIHALVNPYGMAGSFYFVYGTSAAALTSTTAKAALPSGVLGSLAGIAPIPVSATLAGLTTKTTYYYQVVVVTPAGTSSGEILSFTTD